MKTNVLFAVAVVSLRCSEALLVSNGTSRALTNSSSRYSDSGQDKWLSEQFGTYVGYYLDIGAHNGVIRSNTQALDERGWKGICVEPLPVNFGRRTCQLEKTVLTDKTGDTVQFRDCKHTGTDGGDGGLSGIEGIREEGSWKRIVDNGCS